MRTKDSAELIETVKISKISGEKDREREYSIRMTPMERALKTNLYNMLLGKNGEAKHGAFAEILRACFSVRIVPYEEDPDCTAYCDADNMEIGISAGMIRSRFALRQLSVIIRHELGHKLMKHVIRWTALLGKNIKAKGGSDRMLHSSSLFDLGNVLSDFEISNKRYLDPNDKTIARNIKIGAKTISGLVTEDIRPEWQAMTLEQMYRAMKLELKKEWDNFNAIASAETANSSEEKDFMSNSYQKTFSYRAFVERGQKSPIYDLRKWIETSRAVKGRDSSSQEALRGLADYSISHASDRNDLQRLLADIAKSEPLDEVLMKDSHGSPIKTSAKDDLYLTNPEEKLLGAFIIRSALGEHEDDPKKTKTKLTVEKSSHSEEYVAAYNRTIDELDSADGFDVEEAISAVQQVAAAAAAGKTLSDKDIESIIDQIKG